MSSRIVQAENKGRPTTTVSLKMLPDWSPGISSQPGQEIPPHQLLHFPPIKSMEFPFIKLFQTKAANVEGEIARAVRSSCPGLRQ